MTTEPESETVQKLAGWTKEEKVALFYSLRSHRSSEINHLQRNIPTKTTEQITQAIAYYKNLAHKELKPRNICKKICNSRSGNNPRIPLVCWAKLLTDSLPFKNLQTETSTAIRMIADLENIPSQIITEKFDFRKIYLQIANAMEGKPISEDKYIGAILRKCIIETALVSKAFMRTSSLKNLQKSMIVSDKEMNYYPMTVQDRELATIRHLAAQRSYNPFNIPEDFLKPSKNDDQKTP